MLKPLFYLDVEIPAKLIYNIVVRRDINNMELTIKELQENSYSFIFDGTGEIRVGMIGDAAFSIDTLAADCVVKRGIKTDKELMEFLNLDSLLDNDEVEKRSALTFEDLSNLDIEEIK